MSRSFKKNWCSKNNTSGMKKIANHKVRNYDDDIANGKSYRKIFCSYNISDFKTTCYGKQNEVEKHWKRNGWNEKENYRLYGK